MITLAKPEPSWTPPAQYELQAAGTVWDAVQAPSYLGDRALPRIGEASGAVVRDPYAHRLYWLLPPGATRSWTPLSHIQVYGPGCWIEVPPADRTRGLGPYWVVAPRPGRLLTNARVLHAALSDALDAAYGAREEPTR
ncbi:hypothetical protein [Streptomyces sp. Ru87]|uniref:hypothetical protein n=1 Tax=Streptomyces sp. Ru87 TaxID=2044307 RepID=UPI000BF521D7|nr:hypothetical protein [Streptomyces sp. Ru87]PGH48137.1 hypothetical protein CRI70_24885 [Streptomyces sp. Ru87]